MKSGISSTGSDAETENSQFINKPISETMAKQHGRKTGDWGARAPLKFGKKFFWPFLCKFGAFFGQKSCKIREFCYFFGQI